MFQPDANKIKLTLKEIVEAAKHAKWESAPVPDDTTSSQAYVAETETWRITVVSFDIEPQGFPKGSRGHDGAAAGDGMLIRLPREVAEQVFEIAKSKVQA